MATTQLIGKGRQKLNIRRGQYLLDGWLVGVNGLYIQNAQDTFPCD